MMAFSTSGHLRRLSASFPLKLIQARDLMKDIGRRRLVGLIGQQQAISQLEEHVSSEMNGERRSFSQNMESRG